MDIRALKQEVAKQLVEGYRFASQLQILLSKNPDHGPNDLNRIVSGSGPVDELMAKILGSFDKTISVLGSFEPVSVAVPVDGSRNTSSGDSPAAAVSDGRCENSGDCRKRTLGVNKGKRGCYKRQRKSQSWTVESNTSEDAHAWRKYGQKEILNATYPRSYFRCTHKNTQGCRATKQVQKLEHNPEMFQITYIGNHTCNSPNEEIPAKIEPFEIAMDSDNTTCGSCTINDQIKAKLQDENCSDVTGTVLKEELEVDCDDHDRKYYQPTAEDLSLVWQDLAFDEHDLMYGSMWGNE
ncbi:PREDICTED: probable WRKY transcription factor 54 [Tarenaya hassleriana]|uniref:probable WRKY transcription factor 54 n=1 Tax=Tarenaya hassleriana TaxID=28532 RepID=UPI00053C9269|nr:PREDICTED: probable WRKY transcription factor 54 [Tarenaya hassleriana]